VAQPQGREDLPQRRGHLEPDGPAALRLRHRRGEPNLPHRSPLVIQRVEVDVFPSQREGLAAAHPGQEHERDRVRDRGALGRRAGGPLARVLLARGLERRRVVSDARLEPPAERSRREEVGIVGRELGQREDVEDLIASEGELASRAPEVQRRPDRRELAVDVKGERSCSVAAFAPLRPGAATRCVAPTISSRRAASFCRVRSAVVRTPAPAAQEVSLPRASACVAIVLARRRGRSRNALIASSRAGAQVQVQAR
jgi:hypothetical protein